MSPFVLKTTAVKDTRARDKGDPYCLGMFSVSSIHLMEPNDDSEFWEIARQYADGFDSALDKGVDLLRMLNFLPTAPITPSLSSIGFTHDASPQGDKRAHNRLEAMLAEKIASTTPSDGISGTLSNAGFVKLPHGASDMTFALSSGACLCTPW